MKNLIFIQLIFFSFTVRANCPKTEEFRNSVDSISSLKFDNQLSEFLKLEKISAKCNIKDELEYSNLMFKIAGIQYFNGNFGSSKKYLNLAISTLLKKPSENNVNVLAKYFYYLGVVTFYNNESIKAMYYFKASIYYSKKYNSLEFISLNFQYLSEYYYNIGDYQNSIQSATQGLYYSEILNDVSSQYRHYFSLSKSYFQLENFVLSLKFIENAILKASLYQENKKDLGYAFFFKAAILGLKKEKFRLAEEQYLQSIKTYGSFVDSSNLSSAYSNLGFLQYKKLNKLEEGLENSKIALEYCNSGKEKSRIFNNIGMIYYLKYDFLESLNFYQKALQFYQNKHTILGVHLNLEISSLEKSNEKEYLFSILQDKAICWLDYYKATKTKSHLVHALETYELADKLVDYMWQEHTGTLSKYFWRNKTRSLYENAIETCFLLKDYEKAYYFMEKSRAVMLNDKLNELGAKQKLNEADQEKEREYQRKIIELNTKIEAETKTAAKEKLNSQLFDLQEQQERFVKSLETKYPAYYQLKYNTQIGTLKQMQAYLKSNFKGQAASMVSYFFGDSASYAMVISPTKAGIKQFKYDAVQNQAFVNLLAANQGTKTEFVQLLSSGSNIYEKLIKPLNIPKGHLIISQDGVFMPFEALSASANSPQYLLNDYAISYTYSGQYLLKKQADTKFWPNQTFVGFAPVEFTKQLNSLKTSDVTLGNVAKNYWFSDTFTGKGATKANFLQQAKDHKIVQIFTHAFADSVDTEPKIYFADQALKISELNAEDQFKTQLLVLSACKTGVGKLAKGEGVLSLARGFSMLGIPATITSLWSVEDKNTYQLTELFYLYLNEGQSKDEALKNAKLEFLKLHPNSSPSDWAGMVLVGESSKMTNNNYQFFIFGGLSLAVVFVGILFFNRRRNAA